MGRPGVRGSPDGTAGGAQTGMINSTAPTATTTCPGGVATASCLEQPASRPLRSTQLLIQLQTLDLLLLKLLPAVRGGHAWLLSRSSNGLFRGYTQW